MAFTSIVKDINGQSIIDCMRDGEVYTRQALAEKNGLSFPTVSKLVEELVQRKILISMGIDSESRGGRKASLYKMDADYAHVLVMYLQGNKIYVQHCDALGAEIPGSEAMYTRTKDLFPLAFLEQSILEELEKDDKIRVVMLGVPGSVKDGRIYCMDGQEGLEGQDLETILSLQTDIPVCVRNNMSILAEGMAKQTSEVKAYLHLADTGPGVGVVVNGMALQGFSGFQGEVGFMPLYGEQNLQEIALGGFQDVKPGQYLGKLIACICTMLNPEEIVCYIEKDWPEIKEQTLYYCRRYLPEYALPKLIFDRDYRKDYIEGLRTVGTECLFRKMNAGE